MLSDELIIDSFAGGGGASLGIARALGRPVDVAVNHDPVAIAMHAANHPGTRHLVQDVRKVAPREVTRGRPVGLAWFSPDCKHFSRAKGGKPVDRRTRGLAWEAIRWAVEVRPRVIVLENVREFEGWGPLLPVWECGACRWKGTEGQATLARRGRRRCPRCEAPVAPTGQQLPNPDKKGLTFRKFTGRLRNLGYAVQWRVLDAADFGAPTHRRRLFLVARNDGLAVRWPEPTHGCPKKIAAAAGGLFACELKPWRTAAECIDWSLPCPSIFERKRPLAEKTLQRIAAGVRRYVLDNPRPFLVVCNHGGPEFRGQSVDAPLPTVTASRDAHGLVVPYLVPRYGERDGQAPRATAVGEPFGVVTPGGNVGSLAAAILTPMTHGNRSVPPSEPLPTATTQTNRAPLVAAFLAKHYGGVVGVPADTPLPTTTARGTQNQVVAANLVHLNHGDKTASGPGEPMRTVTAGGNHAALVYGFLTKYYRTAVGQGLDGPLHTVTHNDRFGIVTVTIAGEPYVVVDIGMRMLTPRELARGNGFPDSYALTGTATSQTARIGNSVPPDVAEALVRANYAPAARGGVA